jgi:CheY-like chemotaxis protein
MRVLCRACLAHLNPYNVRKAQPGTSIARPKAVAKNHTRTLIAAPQAVVQTLGEALRELAVEVYPGTTSAEAGAHLAGELDLILVCYVFDDVRPYRLINHIRNESPHAQTPLILIRALPVPLGDTQEWEIRQAYKSIGVDEFLNYSQLLQEKGTAEANHALRACVSGLLSAGNSRILPA